MEQVMQANGYRLHSAARLLMPDISRTAQPKPRDYAYDLEQTLNAVLSLRSEIPEDAYTASILGTEREGHGILIDDQGLVLTIGYLISEAVHVTLAAINGKVSQAQPIAYDYNSGFGLVRALEPLDVAPIEIGSSAAVAVGDRMVVGGHGGTGQSLVAKVVSKREFAGYWEYLLDEAIFTAPPHPNWGGAALIDEEGKLAAVGSLFVQDAVTGEQTMRGNMFVPIDMLVPILPELLAQGRTSTPAAPVARHVHHRDRGPPDRRRSGQRRAGRAGRRPRRRHRAGRRRRGRAQLGGDAAPRLVPGGCRYRGHHELPARGQPCRGANRDRQSL